MALLLVLDLFSPKAAADIGIHSAGNADKSTLRIRSDQKWPDYQPWCDRFYFAVGEAFPRELVPDECGLIVADAFSAVVLREAPIRALAPQRRKALTLRAALAARERLQRLTDPGF